MIIAILFVINNIKRGIHIPAAFKNAYDGLGESRVVVLIACTLPNDPSSIAAFTSLNDSSKRL